METSSGSASGSLYYDDGESLTSIEDNQFTYLTFDAVYKQGAGGKLVSTVLNDGFVPPSSAIFSYVSVLGIGSVKNVYVNGQQQVFSYNTTTQALIVQNLDLELTEAFSFTWN
jgi:hypothetical protein